MTRLFKYCALSLGLTVASVFTAPAALAQDKNADVKKAEKSTGHVDYKSPPSPEALSARNQATPTANAPVSSKSSAAPAKSSRSATSAKQGRQREMPL